MSFPPLPPQQQNEIKLSGPRSGEVKYEWDHGQSDANLMLKAKYKKNLNVGSASLIGEIAQIIAKKIFYQNNSSFIFGGVTFARHGTDIMASLGPYSSYASIIEKMQHDGNATRETAEQILKNLSKGCIHKENGDFNLFKLSYEIFEGLDKNAKRLMAVLICETIRFNDDGACARMAMRLVINSFEKGSKTPFEYVFVANLAKGQSPLSIFAASGGKQRMIAQIIGHESAYGNDSIFEKDMAILEMNKNFISDDEDEDKNGSSSNTSYEDEDKNESSSNTSSRSTPMQTRSREAILPGFYKDPPTSAFSSTFPSPAKPQSKSVKSDRNHDTIDLLKLSLDETSEEDSSEQTETHAQEQVIPIAYFCERCKLFYPSFEKQSKCPLCQNEAKEIPPEHLSRFINSIITWNPVKFPPSLEGYFVELSD